MANRKLARKNPFGVVLIALIGMGSVVGLATYVKFAPANKLHDEEKRPGLVRPTPNQHQTDIKVPNPKFDKDNNLTFEPGSVTSSGDPKEQALNAFIARLPNEKGVKVESISMDGNVARVYLPKSFDLNLGSQDEATFLLGIRSSLGQFEDVEAVELYHDGQKLDQLGHTELDGPMPVIRPKNWAAPTKPASEQNPYPEG